MNTAGSRRRDDGLVMEALLHTMRGLTPIAQGLCVLLLLLYLGSGVRFVGPQQSALVLRLGALQPEVHGPGLLLAWPAPLDEVVLLDTGSEHSLILDAWKPLGPRLEQGRHTREVTAEERAAGLHMAGNQALPVEVLPEGEFLDPVKDGYTLTGDWNTVQGQFAVRYRITDPVAYFRAGERVISLLRDLTSEATTQVLGTRTIDESLTHGRDELAQAVMKELAERARRLGLGVRPTAFEIRSLAPPKQVIAAFEEVTSARLQARTLIENAGEYRLQQITETTAQAGSIRQRADAFARQTVAASEGESRAFGLFLVEYRRAPGLLRDRLYSETLGFVMQQVHSSTVLPAGEAPPSIFIEPSTETR